MRGFALAGGAVRYTVEEARRATAGYAFATDPLSPGAGATGAFPIEDVPRWGYRTYDCVEASPQAEFTDLDVFVPAGLNGELTMRRCAALRAAANRAAAPLDKAYRERPRFIDYPIEELTDDPPTGTPGALLAEAWHTVYATPDIGRALTYKLLHHKRPELVPLADNRTLVLLRAASCGTDLWQLVHREVNRHADQFADLAGWFADLAAARDGRPLGWLRLYDLLIWLHCVGQREYAKGAGLRVMAQT
jgi:hypothetical protein